MSPGLFAVWRTLQTKKKKCDRCGLYFDEALNDCSHCSQLDDHALQKLIDNHQQELQGNANLGKKFLMVSLIAAILLILAFMG